MERMSAVDAGFYYIEDENVPMHVGSVAVFEGPAPAYGDLVRLLVTKLPQVPRYRQRVRGIALHLGRPVWHDDEHFQILYHVRHTAVPAPGSAEQLRNLAGRVFAQRLDAAKPLWEMCSLKASRKAAGRSSPRCTTAWSTGSPEWTWRQCSSTRTPTPSSPPR
jgi:diacylglycerol O-acyltransferase / wax synthase